MIAVPIAPRAAPPPAAADLSPLILQLRSGNTLARTRAMLQLGNFNLSPEQAREVVPLLVPSLRRWPQKPYATGSLSEQSAALIALWGVGPEGRLALPEVAAALDFDEMGIRDTAMNAVARMQIRGANAAVVMPAVIRLLEFQPVTAFDQEQHPSAIEKAVRWLGEIGPAAQPAVPALARLAANGGDHRIFILRAIAGTGPGGAGALPDLLRLLDQIDDPSQLQYLIQALAQVGLHDPSLRDPLLATWRRNLQRFPAESPPPGTGGEDMLRVRMLSGLVSWLGSKDPIVIRAVIQAVAEAPEWALNYNGMDGNGPSVGPISAASLGNMAEAVFKSLSPQSAEVGNDLVALVRRSGDRPNAFRLAFLGLQSLRAVPDEFLPLLREKIDQPPGPAVFSRYWVYPALESMGPRAAPAILQLRAQLREGSFSEKSSAARSIAVIGGPAAREAIPEIVEASATVIRGDTGGWALGLLESALKLDSRSQAALEAVRRVIATTNALNIRIEGHRILLELGPDPEPHRAALLEVMQANNDQWAAVAAGILVRDAKSPTTRAAAIDRLFQLLEPLAVVMATPPAGRGRAGSPPATLDFSTVYGAVAGLEELLPGDPGTEARLVRLVRTLWESDTKAREAAPTPNREPRVEFRSLIRILALFETKAPATQALLAELGRDPQFLIREAALGRVNNGR